MQTVYNEFQGQAFAGLVANQEPSRRITRITQDAAGTAFGKAAFRGASATQYTGTPTAGDFLGVTIADITQAEDKYARYSNAGLLNEGVIWVTNGAAVVAFGDPVYVTPAGAWTNVSNANVEVPGATFETSAAAGALVAIRLK